MGYLHSMTPLPLQSESEILWSHLMNFIACCSLKNSPLKQGIGLISQTIHQPSSHTTDKVKALAIKTEAEVTLTPEDVEEEGLTTTIAATHNITTHILTQAFPQTNKPTLLFIHTTNVLPHTTTIKATHHPKLKNPNVRSVKYQVIRPLIATTDSILHTLAKLHLRN
ncbi:hypothetical protein ACHQM5_002795 [Ranunculus cassubicifolius]